MGATYVRWSNYLFTDCYRLKFCVWNVARDPNIGRSCGLEVNKPAERRKKCCQGEVILYSCHVYLCAAPVSETGMCVHFKCDH